MDIVGILKKKKILAPAMGNLDLDLNNTGLINLL